MLAAVLFVGILYQINREEILLTPAQRHQVLVDQQPQKLTGLSSEPVIANAKLELSRAQKALSADAQSSTPSHAAGSAANDAWRMGDATTVSQMPVPGGVSVYEPVSVDMEDPDYPEAGEQVSVSLPGGEQLKVNVKASVTNPNGDYTWRGHLDGYGTDDYPVVMTYGGNSVFATVTTPKGSYTLESVNGSGWIYKNPAEVELSNPEAHDYLEIPDDHH
jgi:hypothetical protein